MRYVGSKHPSTKAFLTGISMHLPPCVKVFAQCNPGCLQVVSTIKITVVIVAEGVPVADLLLTCNAMLTSSFSKFY